MLKPDPENVDPGPIFELAVAFWRSGALLAGLRLAVFARLDERPRPVEELATDIGLGTAAGGALSDALSALGLIQRRVDGCFENTPLAARYLCPGQPDYLGETILFNARTFAAWGALDSALLEDAPAIAASSFLGDDPVATHQFVVAMDRRAQGVARCLAALLPIDGVRRLLDIGGGPGTYARLLAERHPDLRLTVVELPGVLAVARELLAGQPGAERIDLQPGDMYTDDFGTGFDAALLSGIVHRTEGDDTVALLRRAAAALRPGAELFVSDLFLGSNNRGPVLPELFALQMRLTADRGRVLHLHELHAAAGAAGLTVVRSVPFPPPLPHTLCILRRP